MRYGTEQFHYNAKTKTFTAEASSLGRRAADPLFGPGGIMVLVSKKTGAAAEFEVRSTQTSGGDLLGWTLHPAEATVKANPDLRDVRVVVFND